MAAETAPAEDRHARQARDVMAFGQEVGRVLSDGRIVGRAEPFAKVFASSRAVKPAVGLVAWGVLEDIALDARLDDYGRLVADTHVRRIAANLGLSKTTVHKHLSVLREFGFVFCEELRAAGSGRYEQVRYVIDASACVERLTSAPGPTARPTGGTNRSPGSGRGDRVPVSGTRSVYQSTGHGDLVQNTQDLRPEEQQQTAPPSAAVPPGAADQAMVAALEAAGVAPAVAAGLVAERGEQRVRAALTAAGGRRLRNPAGWLVRAISSTWGLDGDRSRPARPPSSPATQPRAGRLDPVVSEPGDAQAEQERERELGWAAAVSAVLDDADLVVAVDRLTCPVPGLGRRSVPAVCAALVRWAQAVAAADPVRPLGQVLTACLVGATPADVPDQPPVVLAAPPLPGVTGARVLSRRVAAVLAGRSGPAAGWWGSCPYHPTRPEEVVCHVRDR